MLHRELDVNEITFGKKLKNAEYINRIAVYGIVINNEGKIAVIKTSTGYFLPGGGVEGVENHIQCLKREFVEETGYDIEVGDYIGKASLFHVSRTNQYINGIGHFYFVNLKSKIRDKIESDHEMLWIEPKESIKCLFLEHQSWAVSKAYEIKMFETLAYIGEKLNNSNILWAVGASILLNQYGLVNRPNDIDIFVDLKDINKADDIFKEIGVKKVYERSGTYSTKYFYEYIINGFDIDVMSGFAVNHSGGVFEYIFDKHSVSEFKKIHGVDIPFTSLEDWYVIYLLIPGREAKVNAVENYLLLNGIRNPFLLERALKGNLPIEVREKIEKIKIK